MACKDKVLWCIKSAKTSSYLVEIGDGSVGFCHWSYMLRVVTFRNIVDARKAAIEHGGVVRYHDPQSILEYR